MLDLDSAHLHPKVVELRVKLPLHLGGFFIDGGMQLVAIDVIDVLESGCAGQVARATHILSHLL